MNIVPMKCQDTFCLPTGMTHKDRFPDHQDGKLCRGLHQIPDSLKFPKGGNHILPPMMQVGIEVSVCLFPFLSQLWCALGGNTEWTEVTHTSFILSDQRLLWASSSNSKSKFEYLVSFIFFQAPDICRKKRESGIFSIFFDVWSSKGSSPTVRYDDKSICWWKAHEKRVWITLSSDFCVKKSVSAVKNTIPKNWRDSTTFVHFLMCLFVSLRDNTVSQKASTVLSSYSPLQCAHFHIIISILRCV
jgi:hypothetical protein